MSTYRLSQLVEDGGQLLAVAAPGRVELDQRVLVVVGDHIVKVLADGHCDRAIVGLGDLLRLQIRLQLTGLVTARSDGVMAWSGRGGQRGASCTHITFKVPSLRRSKESENKY